jgi:hypothetical protein
MRKPGRPSRQPGLLGQWRRSNVVGGVAEGGEVHSVPSGGLVDRTPAPRRRNSQPAKQHCNGKGPAFFQLGLSLNLIASKFRQLGRISQSQP